MSEQDLETRKPDPGNDKETAVVPGNTARKVLALLAVMALIIVVATIASFRADLLKPLLSRVGLSPTIAPPEPVFTKITGDDALSSGNLLAEVGKIPSGVDSSDVGSDVKSQEPGVGEGTSPAPVGSEEAKNRPASEAASQGTRSGAENIGRAEGSAPLRPKSVETPVTVNGSPKIDSGDRSTSTLSGQVRSADSDSPKETRESQQPGSSSSDGTETTKRISTIDSGPAKASSKTNEPKISAAKTAPDWQDTNRTEQFQLPGSLLVKIHNYVGTDVRWELMVIMDDSSIMARQTKAWTPSRAKTSINFVAKLPGLLPPGSYLAVRDFACPKKEGNDKSHRCLSRMLFDWSPAPFRQLREKLENAEWGGHTDPCAAAAFAAKNDFKGQKGLSPRILIISSGAEKCGTAGVIKALSHLASKGKPPVDVLAMGMNPKKKRGYSTLASRTEGMFLGVEKPGEMDQALARYEKVLKAKMMEKIEVRTNKSVSYITPFQEANLAPGTCTVTLPIIQGLDPSRRAVPNVKISPGETTTIEVSIKKGRPTIRTGKK